MQPITWWRSALSALLCLSITAAAFAQSDDFDSIGTRRAATAANWGGRAWTATELRSFQGKPETTTTNTATNYVLVAYDRLVSFYDVANFAPVWVAYVATRESARVAESGQRAGAEFARPETFFADGVIAEASARLDVEAAGHFDYSDKVPPNLPLADRIPKTLTAQQARARGGIIERGHLAPNNTMKCWGTPAQGKKAQYESFSLANVVAQMKKHNAPTWAALEKQCLLWAKELGSVAVVVGPIYADRSNPKRIEDRRTGEPQDIPFPDALFCVVIGKRAGAVAAVGFIMPQQTQSYGWETKAVPIDEIEAATGINFMPAMGEPSALETQIDARWLQDGP